MKKNLLSKSFWIILLFNMLLFAYSTYVRRPWFGVLTGSVNDGTGHHQWLTGSTIIFANNWRLLNPLKIKFALLQSPPSPDTAVHAYYPYGSYPPGAVIPIYLLSLMEGKDVDPAMVMSYNIFSQLLIGISLSLIVYISSRRIKLGKFWSILLATIPSMWLYLTPGPMYWLQNVYFSDQAVLLPLCLLLLLEVYGDYTKRSYSKWQAILMFIAVLTDWLALFVILGIWVKRLVTGQIAKKTWFKDSVRMAVPSLIALSLFLYQVTASGLWSDTINRAIFRLGAAPTASGQYYRNVILSQVKHHFETAYGKLGLPLFILFPLLLLVLYKLIKKDYRPQIIELSLMLYFPILLQMTVFNNHTSVHDFSTLKTVIPLSALIVSSFPVILTKSMKKYQNLALTLIILVNLGYTTYLHRRFTSFFPAVNHEYEQIGKFIKENTLARDVIFSPDYEILVNPPQKLSYSGKLVHLVKSPEEIEKITKDISGDYQIKILVTRPSITPSWVKDYQSDVITYKLE